MGASVVIIMGPQGSGKGTQSELLAKRLGGVHLSSGQLFRDSNDPIIAARLAKGLLARSEDFQRLIAASIPAVPSEKPIIFDGVGRMLHEARWLGSILALSERGIGRVIFLTVPRAESIARLQKRQQLENRHDDSEEGIIQRLNLYEQETIPVLNYYREKNLLVEINGMGSVAEVAERINKVINEAKI